MARYFLEVAYKGTAYGGFQKQENAVTIQGEIEKAILVYFRRTVSLTGSSRTDAGVHANQNFFHFDDEGTIVEWDKSIYHLNAILPGDIVLRSVRQASEEAHSRFDARLRVYEYTVYTAKDPFLSDRGYYFPYPLNEELLNQAARIIRGHQNFKAFSKKHTQVRHFECEIQYSCWRREGHALIYRVEGNRFLRGMVRGLTGTMLRVGTGKLTIADFENIIMEGDATRVDFSVPPQGLRLMEVRYPQM